MIFILWLTTHRAGDDRRVTDTSVILALVVVTALAFDFTNGFHDTANAMATTIATKALRPKTAVALSGLLNLIGAFLSVEVALTVTNAVVKIQNSNGTPKESLTADGGTALLLIVLAGLVGGIVWNLFTWLLGLPSSSSHALFGGLVGATIAGLGWAGVNWNGNGSKLDGVVGKVLLPALISPVIAGVVAAAGTWIIFKITAGVAARFAAPGLPTPEPRIEPVATWVVDSAKPRWLDARMTAAEEDSAAIPCGGAMSTSPLPSVRMIRQPPR